MSFLNPGLLFGLFALAVPFIVLLLFRKKIELHFAAYEWMAKASVKKHKQNWLDDLLKLLAKLLLLLLLVLLMARPTFTGAGGGRRLVVIDTTPSMATVMENGTRLSRAQEMARSFLEEADGSSAVAAFDGTLTPLAPLSDSPDPTVVETAALTGNTGGFEDFITSLLALENLSATPEVVFFTDAQRADFQDPAAIRRLLEPLAPTRIVLVPVDSREDVANLGITRLEPPGEGYMPGRANALQVTVRNFSNQPADSLPVVLKIGERIQDRVTLTLPPGAEQTVDLLVSTPPGTSEAITVELPPDLYPPDDVWNLVADPPSRLRVLAVAPAPGEEPFEYDIFFRSALRAYVPDTHLVYQQVRPPQLLTLRLRNYDVVATFGVDLAAGGAIPAALASYVEDGGALLAFVPPDSSGSWQGLEWDAAPEEQEAAVPDPERLADGILEFMTAPELDASRIRFLRFTTFRAPEAEGLLYLEDQPDPVVVGIERGRGRMAVAGFMPYTGHTDLIYNPNFVQTGMRLLRRTLPESGIRSYTGRELAHIKLPSLEPDARYSLRHGDNPSQGLEVQRPEGEDPFLLGDPLTGNAFATVFRDEEELFTLGYNLTRKDSDIRASAPTDLEPVLSDTLSVRADSSDGGPMKLEQTGLMAFLLLLAIGFDTYAHLWRRT
jgi:hypothetical protein